MGEGVFELGDGASGWRCRVARRGGETVWQVVYKGAVIKNIICRCFCFVYKGMVIYV